MGRARLQPCREVAADFGWRSAFSAAVNAVKSATALAPEVAELQNLRDFNSIFPRLCGFYRDLDSFKRLLNVLHGVAQNHRPAVRAGHWAFGFS